MQLANPQAIDYLSQIYGPLPHLIDVTQAEAGQLAKESYAFQSETSDDTRAVMIDATNLYVAGQAASHIGTLFVPQLTIAKVGIKISDLARQLRQAHTIQLGYEPHLPDEIFDRIKNVYRQQEVALTPDEHIRLQGIMSVEENRRRREVPHALGWSAISGVCVSRLVASYTKTHQADEAQKTALFEAVQDSIKNRSAGGLAAMIDWAINGATGTDTTAGAEISNELDLEYQPNQQDAEAAATATNPHEFEKMISENMIAFLRFASRTVGINDVAYSPEDLVQEAIARTLSRMHRKIANNEPVSFQVGFIVQTMKNIMADHWKSASYRLRYDHEKVPESALQAPVDTDAMLDRIVTVEALEEIDKVFSKKRGSIARQLLWDYFINEMTKEELIEKYNVTGEVIQLRVYRARRYLRRLRAEGSIRLPYD